MQSLKERWETLASIHVCSVFSFSLIASLALFGGLVIFFFCSSKTNEDTPLTHTPAMFKLHTRKSVSVLVTAYLPRDPDLLEQQPGQERKGLSFS